LFSASPSHSPAGTLVPSVVMTRLRHTALAGDFNAVDHHHGHFQGRQVASMSSASGVSVAFFQRRDTNDRPVPFALSSISPVSGSHTSALRRVAAPAITPSAVSCPNKSLG
jgi:hypothetical protein